MDWVHCNVCFYQPGQQPKREFRMASCGHIFCQNCERIGSIEKCKICQDPGTTIVLSHEMREEVQMYFEDVEEVIEKLGKIADFHKSHRNRLNEHYRTVLSKYNTIKEHYFRVIKDNKNLHQENQILKQENQILKQKLEAEQKRNTLSHNMLTPPQSQSRHQVSPFFSNNSQPSNKSLLNLLTSNDVLERPTHPGPKEYAIRPLPGPKRSFGHDSSYKSGRSSPASSLFVTPTQKRVLTPHNYRIQSQVTPGSDKSDSPGSDLGIGYRGSQSQMGRPQTPQYSPGFITPSINGLRNLSVKRRNPCE